MLEVIYNDCYSQLSIVNNTTNETLSIIDDDYHVYETISYRGFFPSIKQFYDKFERALNKHLCMGAKSKDKNILKSLFVFKDWLGGTQQK